ncbi:MAG: hypothetical protein ACKO32_08235 [Planctomycetia bacterium]
MKHARRITTPIFLIALVLAVYWGGVFSWHALHANFQLYDDEGYFLVLVQHLLDGDKPYDEVSTVYGPLYLAYRWLLHGVLGLALSTDGVRLSLLAAWVAIAALCGWTVHAGRGAALSALAAACAALFHLFALSNEPGHPQDLALLVMLAGVLGWAHWRDARPVLAGAALGACVAGSALIKVNLGVYLGLPALFLMLPRSRARWIVLGLIAALPIVLTRAHAGADWRIGLCAASLAACVGLLPLSGSMRSGIQLRWAAISGLCVAAAVLGFALCFGATISGMLRALVLITSRFTSEIVLGIRVPFEALYAAIGAVLLYAASRRFPQVLLPARLGFVVLVLWGALSHLEWLIPFALPFGWLALSARDRPLRSALVALLPLQALLVFPVSGTQETLATLLLIPLAFWALEEALASLPEWLSSLVPMLPLAGCLFVLHDAGGKWQVLYASRPPMLLPGAEATRAVEFTTARAQFLADTVRGQASRFLSVRGDNSVYVWSGIRPASGVIVSHSWKLFDPEQQQELASSHQGTARTLVLDNLTCIPADLRASLPFFRMLEREFVPVARIDFDLLCARRDDPRPQLRSACVVQMQELSSAAGRPRARIAWPAARLEGSVGRIQIGDLERGRGLADSDAPDPRFWPRLVRGEDLFDPRAKRFPRIADLQQGDTVWLELPQSPPLEELAGMRVVFSGPAGRKLLVLPIVIEL